MDAQKLNDLIERLALNKTFLALAMEMPKGTFINKINPRQPAYKFNDEEIIKLTGILRLMAEDINNVTGHQATPPKKSKK